MGSCMGGALSILAGVHAKEADAVVCWYGVPPASAADVRTIKLPLQGHFALDDEFFPPAQVDEPEKRLREGHVSYEFYRYQARHASGNETVANYNRDAAELVWQRTLDFLARHLR